MLTEKKCFEKSELKKIDDLFKDIPSDILNADIKGLPDAKSEIEISSLISDIENKNSLKICIYRRGNI